MFFDLPSDPKRTTKKKVTKKVSARKKATKKVAKKAPVRKKATKKKSPVKKKVAKRKATKRSTPERGYGGPFTEDKLAVAFGIAEDSLKGQRLTGAKVARAISSRTSTIPIADHYGLRKLAEAWELSNDHLRKREVLIRKKIGPISTQDDPMSYLRQMYQLGT